MEGRFGRDRLELVAALEGTHFWFAGRRALVERLLTRYAPSKATAAVDVGCGTGSFLPILAHHAAKVVGVDPLADGNGLLVGDAERLPLEDASFDIAVALDVLEHVDDRAALGEARRVLRPGGILIATVPAFPWLWGPRDELAGHRRRYVRRDVVRLFVDNGFEVLETAYYQFLLFPLVVAGRKLGNATTAEERPSRLLNRVFTAVNTFEARAGRRVPWPWGSTIAVAARRGAR